MTDTIRPTGASWTWLLCPDCSSVVHEVWAGTKPELTLTIELEHSTTCPAWRDPEREFCIAFLPKQGQ